jgi:F5/8 type C domain/Secretion system C-terminal sorting domain
LVLCSYKVFYQLKIDHVLKLIKMKNKYLPTIVFTTLFFFQGFSQCFDNTHTPFKEDSWLSCEMSANPNPVRPLSHWIMYDLGFEYTLDSTYLWNFNTWGMSNVGIQEAVIDYSLDGVNWITLDTFIIDQASASVKYQGMQGPRFEQTEARYILLTALSNWGNAACTGLSEIKFSISETVSTEPDPILSDSRMVVTPNPVETTANISIKSENTPERVALFDLSGRLIEQKTTILSMNITFQMKDLPGGIYFVKAWLGDTVLTGKIVKVN